MTTLIRFKKIFIYISLVKKSYSDLMPSIIESVNNYLNTLSDNRHTITLHITLLAISEKVKNLSKDKPFIVHTDAECTLFKESLIVTENYVNKNWTDRFALDSNAHKFWKNIENHLKKHTNVQVEINETFSAINQDTDKYLNILQDKITPLQKENISLNVDAQITYIKLTANTSMKLFEESQKEYLFIGQTKEEIQNWIIEKKKTNTKNIKPSSNEDQKDDIGDIINSDSIIDEERDNILTKIDTINKSE